MSTPAHLLQNIMEDPARFGDTGVRIADHVQRSFDARTVNQSALQDQSERLITDFDGGLGSVLEQQVIGAANPNVTDRMASLDQAGADAATQSDVAEGVFARRLRGLGISQTARERRVSDRRFGLSRALANVNARTQRNRAISDQADIARAGASSLRDIVINQQNQIHRGLASAENQRRLQFEGDRAQRSANERNFLGNVIGIFAGLG